MLDHEPIPNTVYISSSGFPVMYMGEAYDHNDCSKRKLVYRLLTESFDSERGTMFTCPSEHFKKVFSPISEYDLERKVYKRRVVLLVLGSRFNTFGMLSPCTDNLKLLHDYSKRDKPPVRITSQTRDSGFPRYYEDDECQEAWLENLRVKTYGDRNQYYVLSGDLVSDRLDDEYVKQFFPLNQDNQFVIPNRFVTYIQVETKTDTGDDGRVLLEALRNAFAIV